MFKSIVESAELSSVPNLLKEIVELKKHHTAMRLSAALLGSDTGMVPDLISAYESYNSDDITSTEEETVFISTPVADIIESFTSDNLTSIFPKVLNDTVGGGIPEQTHIIVMAQPEVGKSCFVLNMAAGFCRHNKRVLYVCNEDPIKSMQLRIISRMAGMSRQEVLADVDKAQHEANMKGYDNLIFASLSPGTMREIEALVTKHEPDILIIDQIRQLSFSGVEGEVAIMTKAGKEVRSLTKKHNLITVSVTQAGESASGKLVLDKGDLYMSKTALVGDADILIGIGTNEEYNKMNQRMLTLIKNKINNDHSSIPVGIIPQLSKVISL